MDGSDDGGEAKLEHGGSTSRALLRGLFVMAKLLAMS